MASRDDMIIRPQLTGEGEIAGAAPTRAREERRMAGARRKHGVLPKVAMAARHRRRARLRRAKAVRASRAARGAAGAGRAAGTVAQAGRVAAGGPVAIAVTVAAAMLVAAGRVISGRSFENMGQQVNNLILGDIDDDARASNAARKRLSGNANVAQLVGQQGANSTGVRRIFEELKRQNLVEEKGRSAILSDKEMQTNGVLDMLALRFVAILQESFTSGQGAEATKRMADNYQAARLTPSKSGAR